MNAYKNVSYVGFVLMAFGVVLCIYGFSFLSELQELDSNGIKVKGEVVDINEKAIYRSPIVKFTAEDGQEYTFLSEFEVSVELFSYYIGQEVNVIYHAEDPNNARIDDFWERNFPQLFVGCLGGFLLLFGFFMRRHFLKKAKRVEEGHGYGY